MSAIMMTVETMVTLQALINNGGCGNFSCVSTDMDVRTAWASMDVLESEGLVTFSGATGTITPNGREMASLMRGMYSL